jgi:hypothetical protein
MYMVLVEGIRTIIIDQLPTFHVFREPCTVIILSNSSMKT